VVGLSGTVGNIIARVGADVSPLAESMKEAQNTILTFKDESLAALKSFGIPHISSTNLVEAIQSGQRVVVNFAQESGESLAQFQQRVRTTFAEAGIDITEYEKVLTDADKVHAEFAKGAVKSFQAVSAAAEEVNNKAQDLRDSLGNSFSGIQANFGAFKDSVVNAFQTMTDGSASFGDKIGAVSNAVVDGFGLMTGAIEIFIAIEVVKKVGEWISELEDLAAETQDVEHRFYASMGSMSEEAEQFSKKLSDSYGVSQEAIEGMMGKEYTNTRMLGFDPTQAEQMSEKITQLSYDLGKLKGIDPSEAFDALQRGMEGQTRGLMDLA
jgi:predicted HAD superfamily Cof-like phosphohydrolase